MLRKRYEEYLDDQSVEIAATLRRFIDEEVPPKRMREMDDRRELDPEVWKGLAEIGLFGLGIPEEYGGIGASERAFALVGEELARGGASLTFAFFPTAGFCARSIAKFGTEEQKRRFLPAIAKGELRLAIGLTEPDAGSDLAGLRTRAVRDGDHYVVTGSKIFSTAADIADYQVALVRTDPESTRTRGLSLLMLPTSDPGFVARPLDTLTGHAVHTCEVQIQDVRVPVSNLLGPENGGLKLIGNLLDAIRIESGAQGVGYGRGALELALKHAGERRQFDRVIGSFQSVAHMVADMWVSLEAARLAVLHAAWRYDHGLSTRAEAALAKILGSEAGTRAAAAGMQVLGGYSYMRDFPMERYYRESKLMEIVDGTNQIQRTQIAKLLGLPVE